LTFQNKNLQSFSLLIQVVNGLSEGKEAKGCRNRSFKV
jgi:hypothetical protein